MEYEKHIKRLVLGYLKDECKKAYKVFLKVNFSNHNKHIATRVAGQTLEDILRIYSRVQDIVQGRLEETDYYNRNSQEFASPVHLAEQLIYLLEADRPFTPASTCHRSPAPSSIVETQDENEDTVVHSSDVETTPEHTLPGNIPSNNNDCHSRTPFRRKMGSPVFRTPFLEKLPNSEQENISSVMTKTLLKKKEFHKKLADNINTALNTPEFLKPSNRSENEVNKKNICLELEETIRNALSRTEADPIFEDILQDFLDPVASTIEKAIITEATVSTSSSSTTSSITSSKKLPNPENQTNGAVSSILAVSNINDSCRSYDGGNERPPENAISSDYVAPTEHCSNNVAPVEQLGVNLTPPEQIIGKQFLLEPPAATAQSICSASEDNTQVFINSSNIYSIPSANQPIRPRQQFYIVNQPIIVPLVQPGDKIDQTLGTDSSQSLNAKVNPPLTEQDIMGMPTIILNERNEITYADPGNHTANTPFKLNEVHNIKEYLHAFDSSERSPIIKLAKTPKPKNKTQWPLKSTPTIKVEIFNHDSVPPNPIVLPDSSKQLPDISDNGVVLKNDLKDTSGRETSRTTPETKIDSNDKSKPRSLGSVCTPSPVVSNIRKPTPKSSSHVRNLTFPSPVRKSSNEKLEGKTNSPSVINKKQATKHLFRNRSTSTQKSGNTTEDRNSPKKKVETGTIAKKGESQKSKSTRKASSPRKQPSLKKVTTSKSTQEELKKEEQQIDEIQTSRSWDAVLRQSIRIPVYTSPTSPIVTPRPRKSSKKMNKQTTDLDISDTDGKKLAEALKTPVKSNKNKSKRSDRNKVTKSTKRKSPKKIIHLEEETKVEATKIVSPSKLCNTASKRNMEVDGITPINTRKGSHQFVSNARKNINSLLETPLKKDGTPSTPDITSETTNTPFTQMLKANLKDFTGDSTFSIDTPNLPMTPGFSLMGSSSAAYCILNDTDTNKATEAIVLSEEKKSSVRKTDDEELDVISPKVYGCKTTLNEFNKSCVGKKNLELLDNRGVTWDGSSDKADKTDGSETSSDGESNNTVVHNSQIVRRNVCTSGKCMTALKSQMLGENKYQNEPPEKSSLGESTTNLESAEILSDISESKSNRKLDTSNGTPSSSDSETVLKDVYRKRRSNSIEDDKEAKDNLSNAKMVDQTTSKESNIDILSMTAEIISQTVATAPIENRSNRAKTRKYDVIVEMEEKRRRAIKLDKSMFSGHRKIAKCQTKSKSQSNKRKCSTPKKLRARTKRQDEKCEIANDPENVDSQDEFFKKIGSNLHRTNKQSLSGGVAEKAVHFSEDYPNTETSVSTEASENKPVNKEANKNFVTKNSLLVEPREDEQSSKLVDQSVASEEANDSFCIMESQPEEIIIMYDEQNVSEKLINCNNLDLEKKVIQIAVPLTDGSVQIVQIGATPFKVLWEANICASNNDNGDDVSMLSSGVADKRASPDYSSDSENTGCKIGESDEPRCAKKRKHRSDSCNSNSSSKKIKTSMLPKVLNQNNIAKLLTKLHGPNEIK